MNQGLELLQPDPGVPVSGDEYKQCVSISWEAGTVSTGPSTWGPLKTMCAAGLNTQFYDKAGTQVPQDQGETQGPLGLGMSENHV